MQDAPAIAFEVIELRDLYPARERAAHHNRGNRAGERTTGFPLRT
jgi:hypothetical protein